MFLCPVRVYYEDTDSGGIVYYANYLKFMERARTEWLRGLGIEQDELASREGILFAVRAVTLDFLCPSRFNELLHVTAQVIKRGRASILFAQEVLRLGGIRGLDAPAEDVFSTRRRSGGVEESATVICAGHVKIACLDAATLRPCRIPDYLSEEIACDD